MPQGRRKTPFSGKAKREQLKSKKQSKQQYQDTYKNPKFLEASGSSAEDRATSSIQKINFQPMKDDKARSNRYVLQFFKETNEEIAQRKELARNTLEPKEEPDLEINGDDYFDENLGFPKRPPWNFNLGKDKLEAQENKYFMEYIKEIENKFNWKDLSFFELNLETWRQLWRVLELSDIILFILDIRFSNTVEPPLSNVACVDPPSDNVEKN